MNLSQNKPWNLLKIASQAKEEAIGHENKKDLSVGKTLIEEVVPERVSGELTGTFKVYLDSCNSEFESVESIKCCGSLSTFATKQSSEKFVDLFSEKIKLSRDKYAVLRVRWYKYAREVLRKC